MVKMGRASYEERKMIYVYRYIYIYTFYVKRGIEAQGEVSFESSIDGRSPE